MFIGRLIECVKKGKPIFIRGEKGVRVNPVYVDDQWIEKPDNEREIIIWENFVKENILLDFYETLENH